MLCKHPGSYLVQGPSLSIGSAQNDNIHIGRTLDEIYSWKVPLGLTKAAEYVVKVQEGMS